MSVMLGNTAVSCADCSKPIHHTKLPQGEARCYRCRQTRPAGLMCAVCQRPMWKGSSSQPQGVATCRKCRADLPKAPKTPPKRTPCIGCGTPSLGVRCRKCRDIAQRIRSGDDPYVQRWRREYAAPGLNQYRRKALLRRWIQQGRTCAYCTSTATTIDHVLPLVRGGTNYEGNLTPCCRSCNSRKAGLTLIEWRTGKRLKPMTLVPPWMTVHTKPLRIKAIRGTQVELFKVCTVCGVAYYSKGKADQCSRQCYDINYRAEHRQLVPRLPCMDCDEGAFPRTQRCDACKLNHKRIQKRAAKARARARRRLAVTA